MKKERKTIMAKLDKKQEMSYFPMPGRFPEPTPLFEVTFQTAEGDKTFEISSFEYNVLEDQEEGLLTYEGKDLISFSDKIKEFHME